VHDTKLFSDTLLNIIIDRPQPTPKMKQNLCADKGYDSAINRVLAEAFDYVEHIKSRGEEEKLVKQNKLFRARRWVVERTHSWINRFRRLLIRWEKKAENYLAMLHIAFAYITLHAAGVLG
jgi:transposase